MKKNKLVIILGIIIVGLIGVVIFLLTRDNSTTLLEELPTPEVTGGERGELGIDANINESTIDSYLNRSDSVYYDLRMLVDPGDYESIGGDSYLSGFIQGFEVLSLPYIVNVTDLPDSVGDTYTGDTLFTLNDDGTYTENYEESMDILEYFFPKDKYIFLMCGGGGYAGAMKNMLVALGWDEDMIYNVGGYWYYDGVNNVEVKRTEGEETYYDFWKVSYHEIDFSTLTKVENE